jgi:hypothetical protein
VRPLQLAGAHNSAAKSTEAGSRALGMLSVDSLKAGNVSCAARAIGRAGASIPALLAGYAAAVASSRSAERRGPTLQAVTGYVAVLVSSRSAERRGATRQVVAVVLLNAPCDVTTTAQAMLAVRTAARSTLDVTTDTGATLEVSGSMRTTLVVTTETQATSEASTL